MAFTGHKMGEPLFVQRVGVAVSDDLLLWEKLPENPTSEADPVHYELVSTGDRTLTPWRDPFLLDMGEEVIQYVCAKRTEGDITLRGTIGLARSTDMRSWETLPPLEHDPIAEEMEAPQIHEIGGRCYLVFCTKEQWLSPSYKSRFPVHTFRDTNYSMVGESPLGPFRLHGTGEIMSTGPPSSWYASQIVRCAGEWFLLSTVTDDAGRTSFSDPVPVVADETTNPRRHGAMTPCASIEWPLGKAWFAQASFGKNISGNHHACTRIRLWRSELAWKTLTLSEWGTSSPEMVGLY